MSQIKAVSAARHVDLPSQGEPRRSGTRGLAAQRAHLASVAHAPLIDAPARRLRGTAERTAIWEPAAPSARASAIPTSSEVLARTVAPESLPPELEQAIIAVLTGPLSAGESHHTGNDRRERELCALLATLELPQAHQLGRRLDLDRATDAVARAFHRMTSERRQRVRSFIADARRRHALMNRR